MKLPCRAGTLAGLFVALALSLTFAVHVERVAPLRNHTRVTFGAFDQGLEQYRKLPRPWRTRIFSNALAALFVSSDAGAADPQTNVPRFAREASLWAGAWFLATCLLYLVVLRERSLFFALGTFAAVIYGTLPGIDARLYPWDLPALFWYALFTLAVAKKRLEWLACIPLAVGFKETALVYLLAFLFWEGASWKKRIRWFLATGLAAVLVKVGIDLLTHNPRQKPQFFFTMASGGGGYLRENVKDLLEFDANHLLFVNAGLLTAFFLSPVRGREGWMLRLVALSFLAGTFVWGNTEEVRIFFELVPLCLLGLARAFMPELVSGSCSDLVDRPT